MRYDYKGGRGMQDHPRHVMPQHDTETASAAERAHGLPYRTPIFEVYGPIQALTLGGSIGAGESGTPTRNPLSFLGLGSNPSTLPTEPTDPSRQ